MSIEHLKRLNLQLNPSRLKLSETTLDAKIVRAALSFILPSGLGLSARSRGVLIISLLWCKSHLYLVPSSVQHSKNIHPSLQHQYLLNPPSQRRISPKPITLPTSLPFSPFSPFFSPSSSRSISPIFRRQRCTHTSGSH